MNLNQGDGDEEEDLYALFVTAQRLETEGDVQAAVDTYESIVAAADRSTLSASRKRPRERPPAALLASCSLTCIGGHYLDIEDIDEAKNRFHRASLCWPENALAKINLANIEREWGDEDEAVRHYKDVLRICKRADEQENDGSSPEETEASINEWREELVDGPRRVVNAMAHYLLAGMLHQRLAFDEALTHINAFGFRYRLSPALWTAAHRLLQWKEKSWSRDDNADQDLQPERQLKDRGEPDIRLIRNALDERTINHLQEVFGVGSPFWEGTDYHSRGYFSFHYNVSSAPSNAIEKIIKHKLLPLLGRQDIQVAEWWVHSRVCGRSLGHQLHFDTEEASLSSNREIHHPAVSSVLYVSVLPNADPTIVLNQRVGDGPAEKAFVVPPSQGSFLTFPGDLLHGVLPSALTNPTRRPRITLMVGFWTKPVSKLDEIGPCGSLPKISSSCTWPTVLQVTSAEEHPQKEEETKPVQQPGIIEVPSPWEDLISGTNKLAGDRTDALKSRLDVPEELDQRFYVKEMESFRAQLVERMLD